MVAWWGWWNSAAGWPRSAAAPSRLVAGPESNMAAAAEVVFAMVVAAGGRGWLWWPSYVVTRMVLSSAHRCTCKDTCTYKCHLCGHGYQTSATVN